MPLGTGDSVERANVRKPKSSPDEVFGALTRVGLQELRPTPALSMSRCGFLMKLTAAHQPTGYFGRLQQRALRRRMGSQDTVRRR